jgi:signal transduction histidine kinase
VSSWVFLPVCWSGWAVGLAALWTLRRRMARVADAEHELRGAATAMGLAADREAGPLLRLELDRMSVALADLAAVRGARPTPPSQLEGGRLAQVLANVVANAAEHGVGPVEVSTRREGRVVTLQLSNRDGPSGARLAAGKGRGRGIAIAKRAARELGGRLTVERVDGRTRAVVELPADEAPGAGGDAGPADRASPADRRRAA